MINGDFLTREIGVLVRTLEAWDDTDTFDMQYRPRTSSVFRAVINGRRIYSWSLQFRFVCRANHIDRRDRPFLSIYYQTQPNYVTNRTFDPIVDSPFCDIAYGHATGWDQSYSCEIPADLEPFIFSLRYTRLEDRIFEPFLDAVSEALPLIRPLNDRVAKYLKLPYVAR